MNLEIQKWTTYLLTATCPPYIHRFYSSNITSIIISTMIRSHVLSHQLTINLTIVDDILRLESRRDEIIVQDEFLIIYSLPLIVFLCQKIKNKRDNYFIYS